MIINIISVLPKGRFFTVNSGTKVAVSLGMNRYGKFPLLSASHSFLATELIFKDLKRLKNPRGNNVEVRRVDLANWALRTSPKFTTGVKYQFYQSFDYIRDPEIPITLRPLYIYSR